MLDHWVSAGHYIGNQFGPNPKIALFLPSETARKSKALFVKQMKAAMLAKEASFERDLAIAIANDPRSKSLTASLPVPLLSPSPPSLKRGAPEGRGTRNPCLLNLPAPVTSCPDGDKCRVYMDAAGSGALSCRQRATPPKLTRRKLSPPKQRRLNEAVITSTYLAQAAKRAMAWNRQDVDSMSLQNFVSGIDNSITVQDPVTRRDLSSEFVTEAATRETHGNVSPLRSYRRPCRAATLPMQLVEDKQGAEAFDQDPAVSPPRPDANADLRRRVDIASNLLVLEGADDGDDGDTTVVVVELSSSEAED
jgi:hypothetical protein